MNGSKTLLTQTFLQARALGYTVLIGYLPAGFPTPAAFLDIVEVAITSGLRILELGLPTDNPYLDGPVIQEALSQVRTMGVDMDMALELGYRVQSKLGCPIIAMGYADAARRYGLRALVQALAGKGLDGILLPDLPCDEFPRLANLARMEGLAAIGFTAANRAQKEIHHIIRHASGFLYIQTMAEHTGAKTDLREVAQALRIIKTAAQRCSLPVAVGFGIQSPEQVKLLHDIGADGVVIGTALIQAAAKGQQAVHDFVSEMASAAGLSEEG